MARVVWTLEALTNLELIRAYIHQFDPSAAQRLAIRLIEAGDSLRDFPERGRPATSGHRELLTIRPYIIRYRLQSGTIFITSMRHSSQHFEHDG